MRWFGGGFRHFYFFPKMETTPKTPLFNTPQSDYEKSFQVNVYSMIQICGYFAPRMKERGFGRIINVTSGIRDTPILDAYSLSKAAVDKYTRDLAIELEGSGVLANMMDPGWCRTDLGGSDAFNDVSTVLPGALIPALLGKEEPEAPKGMLFAAQDYAGIKWRYRTENLGSWQSPWILRDFRSSRRPLPEIQDFWNRKGLLSETGSPKQAWYLMQAWYKEKATVGGRHAGEKDLN